MAETSVKRRKVLKTITIVAGGAMGAAIAAPIVRYVLDPVGKQVVSSTSEPLDVAAADDIVAGAPPVLVELVADSARDAWAIAERVTLGGAWLRKTDAGEIQAFSSACPHLGCSIRFDGELGAYRCPCHKSQFSVDGDRVDGPSKRSLDPLPVIVENGRVKITFVRFRADIAERVMV